MAKTDEHTTSPHHLPAGTMLCGRYRIDAVLGEGGFGITYKGFDETLEVDVAIKEYFPKGLSSRDSAVSNDIAQYTGAMSEPFEKGKERFLSEARTMAKMLQSPEIAQVRDYFEENNTAYIIMEYIDGKTLTELVRERGGRLSRDELLPMIRPLFSALSLLHENDLIHKDISPDNIMLVDGRVKLLDFGCARADGGNATANVYVRHGFSPLEQYVNSSQGARTDVYALAAVIYYCLTGKEPQKAVERSLNDELAPPRGLGADITQTEEKALLYALNVKPNRRYQSMTEFERALYGEECSALTENAGNGEPGRKRAVYIISAAILATAALICAIFTVANRYRPKVYTGPDGETVTIDEREIFADAVTVRSAEEFFDAIKDVHTRSVIVDGNITLAPEEHILLQVPLMISKDASLTIDPAIASDEHDYGIIMDSNTYLVNYGSMNMVNKGPNPNYWLINGIDFITVNHGEINGSMFIQNSDISHFINDGVLTTYRYSGLASGSFWNFGRIDLESEEGCSNGIECQGSAKFYNDGEINVYNSAIWIRSSEDFINGKNGTIDFCSSGVAEIQGRLVNYGDITFDSTGILREYGKIEDIGRIENNGQHLTD